jgi:putative glutamine amidotransferase
VGKKTISVHSFHHEAIDPDSSSTLVVAAEARDGVVEAVQSHDERLLGFQFHPELMATPEGEKIMRAVAGAVAGARRKRRSRGSGEQGR